MNRKRTRRGYALLQAGQSYADLGQAISICLLRQILFANAPAPHHHFQMVDTKQGMELPDAIEVHTVEELSSMLSDLQQRLRSRGD